MQLVIASGVRPDHRMHQRSERRRESRSVRPVEFVMRTMTERSDGPVGSLETSDAAGIPQGARGGVDVLGPDLSLDVRSNAPAVDLDRLDRDLWRRFEKRMRIERQRRGRS